MNKFLRTQDILIALRDIIEEAKEELILMSPFIKIDKNFQRYLNKIKKILTLKIIVVYGNNKDNPQKSLNNEDFDFLQDFPNIEIRYINNLHGKYYANENKAIITSMNLYDYSKNNTEFGILLCKDNDDKNDLFTDTKKRILKEIEISDLEYHTANEKLNEGYCIRTGNKIAFNIEMPYCPIAFKEWYNGSKNKNEAENYCHLTGEKSFGKTSKARPVLYKNWKQLKNK